MDCVAEPAPGVKVIGYKTGTKEPNRKIVEKAVTIVRFQTREPIKLVRPPISQWRVKDLGPTVSRSYRIIKKLARESRRDKNVTKKRPFRSGGTEFQNLSFPEAAGIKKLSMKSKMGRSTERRLKALEVTMEEMKAESAAVRRELHQLMLMVGAQTNNHDGSSDGKSKFSKDNPGWCDAGIGGRVSGRRVIASARGMECKRHRQRAAPSRLPVEGTHGRINIHQNERDLKTMKNSLKELIWLLVSTNAFAFRKFFSKNVRMRTKHIGKPRVDVWEQSIFPDEPSRSWWACDTRALTRAGSDRQCKRHRQGAAPGRLPVEVWSNLGMGDLSGSFSRKMCEAERVFDVQRVVAEEEKVELAYISMDGSDGYWINVWKEKSKNRSWDSLKEALVIRFRTVVERLATSKWKGTVDDSVQDLKILAGHLGNEREERLPSYPRTSTVDQTDRSMRTPRFNGRGLTKPNVTGRTKPNVLSLQERMMNFLKRCTSEQKGLANRDAPADERELFETLKDIKYHFFRDYNSRKEVTRMLQANKIQEEWKSLEEELPPPKPPDLNWREVARGFSRYDKTTSQCNELKFHCSNLEDKVVLQRCVMIGYKIGMKEPNRVITVEKAGKGPRNVLNLVRGFRLSLDGGRLCSQILIVPNPGTYQIGPTCRLAVEGERSRTCHLQKLSDYQETVRSTGALLSILRRRNLSFREATGIKYLRNCRFRNWDKLSTKSKMGRSTERRLEALKVTMEEMKAESTVVRRELHQLMRMVGAQTNNHDISSDGSQNSVNNNPRKKSERRTSGYIKELEEEGDITNVRRRVVAEEEKVELAYISMKGSAGYWIKVWKEKAKNRSWDGLKEALVIRFGTIVKRLAASKWKGTVGDSVQDLKILAGHCIEDESKVKNFRPDRSVGIGEDSWTQRERTEEAEHDRTNEIERATTTSCRPKRTDGSKWERIAYSKREIEGTKRSYIYSQRKNQCRERRMDFLKRWTGEQKGLAVREAPADGRELFETLKDIKDHFFRDYNSGKEEELPPPKPPNMNWRVVARGFSRYDKTTSQCNGLKFHCSNLEDKVVLQRCLMIGYKIGMKEPNRGIVEKAGNGPINVNFWLYCEGSNTLVVIVVAMLWWFLEEKGVVASSRIFDKCHSLKCGFEIRHLSTEFQSSVV
ncbi:hypothetical protein V8G54_017774 [Vigna mungo]|uniref:Uncharacterized protein n=1 Tax=Vigna mungo TaxID=3915 RepID=A0AAQ3NMT8_VIGMU